jgi:hypothetical protein
MLGGRFFSFTKMLFEELSIAPRKLRQHRWPSGFPSDAGRSMHRVNSILMQAPPTVIFETATNLKTPSETNLFSQV